jgi:hypothetical protein
MKGGLLLDFVVGKGETVLNLLTRKEDVLIVWGIPSLSWILLFTMSMVSLGSTSRVILKEIVSGVSTFLPIIHITSIFISPLGDSLNVLL